MKYTGSWIPIDPVVEGLKPGISFAATQKNGGSDLSIYYQNPDDDILELSYDEDLWYVRAVVGNAL